MRERLKKAILLILYDNSIVNRGTSEEEALGEATARVEKHFPKETLDKVEAELQTLSDTQLLDVCCGEQYTSISEEADAVLNIAFEEP